MKYSILITLVLTACNQPTVATVPTTTVSTETTATAGPQGDRGADGTDGTNGAAGANGTNGSNGTNAPTFRLQDASGNLLPGLLVGDGLLYDDSEQSIAIFRANGIQSPTAYFTTNNCTGNPFTNSAYVNQVYLEGGALWLADPSNHQGITYHSVRVDGACSSMSGSQDMVTGLPYSGVFQISYPAPYRVIKE